MRERIVQFMEDFRYNRIRGEIQEAAYSRVASLVSLYHGWRAEQPDKTLLPRAIDVLKHAPVYALFDMPVDQDFTDELANVCYTMFGTWCKEWKDECDEQLRQLVRSSPDFADVLPADLDPLSLASMVFTCKKCDVVDGREPGSGFGLGDMDFEEIGEDKVVIHTVARESQSTWASSDH